MKRSVLYGTKENERENIINYLSECIEKKEKKDKSFISHLYPVSTGHVSKRDYELSDSIINVIKDYENNVPEILKDNVSTILINGSLAERIFKASGKQGKINGYDTNLASLIYDQVYVIDKGLMAKADDDPVLAWFKNEGAVLVSVPGVSVQEKAEFIYSDSLASGDVLNPKRDHLKESEKVEELKRLDLKVCRGIGYY
jgi:hypothetical protein